MSEVKPHRRPGRPSEEPFLPMVLYARDSVRLLISKHGCEVGSCLLALDLLRAGHRAAVVTGYVVRDAERTPHTWIEVEGRILDPTQEQFGVPPEATPDAECYSKRTGSLAEPAEIEAFLTEKLVRQTRNEDRRRVVEEVARRHGLVINSHALLEAHRPLMERLTIEMNSGESAVTPISELGSSDDES